MHALSIVKDFKFADCGRITGKPEAILDCLKVLSVSSSARRGGAQIFRNPVSVQDDKSSGGRVDAKV
jgi:hypothetical protein